LTFGIPIDDGADPWRGPGMDRRDEAAGVGEPERSCLSLVKVDFQSLTFR